MGVSATKVNNTVETQKEANRSNIQKAREVSRQLESLLLSTLFEQMFESVGKSDLFGGGNKEHFWQGFLTNEFAEATSKSFAGNGLFGDIIFKSIEKNVEKYQEMLSKTKQGILSHNSAKNMVIM